MELSHEETNRFDCGVVDWLVLLLADNIVDDVQIFLKESFDHNFIILENCLEISVAKLEFVLPAESHSLITFAIVEKL